MASYRKRNCKCPPEKKRCNCGAKWYYRIDNGIDPQTGKRKQLEKGGFATKKEAEIAAAQLEIELDHGTFVAKKHITFEEFTREWLEWYASTDRVKISTVFLRKRRIKYYLLPYFAKLNIADISKARYQNMLLDLHKKGYAYNTITSADQTAKMIFKRAIELGLLKTDPTVFSIVPKRQKTVAELENQNELPKYLEKEELAVLLKTAKKQEVSVYTAIQILAYTGARIGELCALKWSDVNLDENTISITKTLHSASNNTIDFVLLTPKTKSSIRTIEIDETLNQILKEYKIWQNKIYLGYPGKYFAGDFVMIKTRKNFLGYPENSQIIRKQFKKLLNLSGLNPSLTPHSLRHTHTSLLAEAGVSLEAIMERLGHQNDSTTRNIYLHITKDKKKEAAQKFSQLMNSF